MQNKLFKIFLKFSYGSWLGLFLGLAITMLTTRLLPPDALGKASMFDLIIKVGMIISIFGTDRAFVRFFYEEVPGKRGALLYNSLRIPMMSTLVIVCLIIILYKPLTYYLFGNENFSLAIWISVGVIFQLLFRYSQLVIRMQQKGNLYSIIQVSQKIITLISIIVLFYFLGSQYVVLVYSNVLMLVILFFVAMYFGRDFWNLKNLHIKDVKHKQNDIFRFGAPFVLTTFIIWVFESFDKIALRQWSTFHELGNYAAAMKLVGIVMVLQTTFSTFWSPVAYERFEKKPYDKLFFKNITIIVSFLMYLVAILSVAGKDIVVLLLGKEYINASTIMPFLVFLPVFYTISHTTVIGINFHKKTMWHLFIALIACIVNILGNWFLVPNYGALGASLATAFSFMIFFTLRTFISLLYFKVRYPLFKIYFMMIIVSLYALYSVFNSNILHSIMLGLILILILILVYYRDINQILRKKREF